MNLFVCIYLKGWETNGDLLFAALFYSQVGKAEAWYQDSHVVSAISYVGTQLLEPLPAVCWEREAEVRSGADL